MPGLSRTMVGLLICLGESDSRFLYNIVGYSVTLRTPHRQQVGEKPLGDFPVLQHIAYAGWCAEVVFQYIERAIMITYQVDARYVDVNIIRHLQLVHLP